MNMLLLTALACNAAMLPMLTEADMKLLPPEGFDGWLSKRDRNAREMWRRRAARGLTIEERAFLLAAIEKERSA